MSCLRFALPALLLMVLADVSRAAETFILGPETWERGFVDGKEADAIYGDIALRNNRLHAVIGDPVPGRKANMTVPNVGGCIIDLSVSKTESDQLSAFYPGGRNMVWKRSPDSANTFKDSKVMLSFVAATNPDQATVELSYVLDDDAPFVLVETVFRNKTDKALEVQLVDEMRADTTFEKTPNGQSPYFWVYDPWFGQAYGLVYENAACDAKSDARWSTVNVLVDGKPAVRLEPGKEFRLVRRLIPAANLLNLREVINELGQTSQRDVMVKVRDTAGSPVADATVKVSLDDTAYASARTDSEGNLRFRAPEGMLSAEIAAVGHGADRFKLWQGENQIQLPQAGWVNADIRGEKDGPTPCKVAFHGRDGTPSPNFGPASGEHAVQNLYYSHTGKFRQKLAPGKYDVVISYGPEYDAIFTTIEVERGKGTSLVTALRRSVKTPGWISADFHSHSSPSGDNTSSQLGRVLNLLCEHIEFAPCTEHNRISTYDPHLEHLGAKHLLATCTGIELTGSPLPLNHQNAFPLVQKPRTQDGGGPQTDASPQEQIARLALWDNRSEKLVQQNHPDLGNLLFDRNGDGEPDGGFEVLPYMDVVEVHPPHWIFEPATIEIQGRRENNTIFNWLQLLNQGRRVPGVVNTDAHYNFHGSGFLRVYVRCHDEDVANIKPIDIVHAAEKGNILMTSGPFMEVSASAEVAGKAAQMGEDLVAANGKVTLNVAVQCPNWFDIDRVQILLNGKPESTLNFTRDANADMFKSDTLKFSHAIPVELTGDTHLTVVAAGQKSTLGTVMGPDHGKDMPIAVSNPIYVDVDGGGFKANGDTLGAPLPVKSGARK
jgi:hypothetical protein